MDKTNEELKEKKRKLVEYEPYSFYQSAWEEDQYVIAQANVTIDDKGRIVHELVNARQAGNFVLKRRDEIDYIDVSPKQLVSVAASLIPFLENDDANRALMGSNMQRQSVPLLRAQSPLVGTGMEEVTRGIPEPWWWRGATAWWTAWTASASSCGLRVTATPGTFRAKWAPISISSSSSAAPTRTPASTRSPIVHKDQRGTSRVRCWPTAPAPTGRTGAGRNVLVAFMPWRGYNFEDAILVSEKLVKEDSYTSIHIEEFEIEDRDTKLGTGRNHARHSQRCREPAARISMRAA